MKKICPKCVKRFEADGEYCTEDQTALVNDYSGENLSDRYLVKKPIGFGGMAGVYEGEHLSMERKVAIKILPTHDPQAAGRFRREAKATSVLENPHTITVYDFGEMENGDLYLVMEMLSGVPLSRLTKQKCGLDGMRAMVIIEQCLHSLKEAHDENIVHRDLKPDNIFLTERDSKQDFVKVLDFGIAKITAESDRLKVEENLTQTGTACGTPHYMAPEQASGGDIDRRTDIYSLGVVLYSMLTGQHLFEGSSAVHVLSKHVYEPPPSLRKVVPKKGYSQELEAFILKCIQKKPEYRFQDAEEMRIDVEKFIAGELPLYGTGISEDEIGTQMVPTDSNLQAIYEGSHSDVDVVDVVPASASKGDIKSSSPRGAMVGIGVVLLVGLIAVFQSGGEEKENPVAVKTSVASSPKESNFEIESTPPGAEVALDGKVLGRTPVKTTLPAQESAFTFSLSLKGHKSHALSCKRAETAGETTTCSATLQPLPKKRMPKPRVTKSEKPVSNPTVSAPKKKPVVPVKEKPKKKPKTIEPQIDLID